MNVMTKEDRALRETRRRNERLRRLRVVGIGMLVPALIALVYYAFIAREQYVANVRFTIQGLSPAPPDLLANIGLPAASGRTNDGHIIVDFIGSPQMVRALRRDYGFDKAYSAFTFDPAGYIPPNSSIELASAFWSSQATAGYDPTSNVVAVTVHAFTADDALRLAQGVMAETEKLVNSLNLRVRNEATRVAERELDAKKADYDAARQRITQLRASRSLTLDAETQQQVGLLGGFESQLAALRVDRAAAQATFQPGSPQMRAMDEKIAALEAQRSQLMTELTRGPGTGEASRDITAQTALLDYEFAQKAYYAAVQALQGTISTRDNERRYLVAYIPPTRPEQSNYWERFSNVIAVAFGALIVMGVGALTYSIVKDHMQ
jgi:capsular polysaccharide transport system permease protein